MKYLVFLFFTYISLILFTGCETTSSSTGNTIKKITLSGAVIDGYIKNSSVCLDLNMNGSCDVSEPSTLTSNSGAFSFGDINVTGTLYMPVIASGGTDTATNKSFTGKFKSIVDTDNAPQAGQLFVTPLTDMIATSFLNSPAQTYSSLQASIKQIAVAYKISEGYSNKSPMQYAGVFAITQEIQQTLALIETAATKAKGISLTSVQLLQLQREIKSAIITQISEDVDINIEKVLTKLETLSTITIPANEKSFLTAQVAELKVAIDSFVANKNLTAANLNTYQAALETEQGKVIAALENAASGASLTPIKINIDIFAVPDTNTTDTNTTDTNTTDTNSTVPVESNTTTLSFGGVMVDSYISGAKICLDLDSNGVCGTTEPSTTTDGNGTFSFTNLKVNKNTMIPLIGFGGTDIATNKSFSGEFQSILDVNSTLPTTKIALTPFTDLAKVLFFQSTIKNKAAFEASATNLGSAFGLSSSDIVSDTMQNIQLFALSQEIQITKSLIEFVAKKVMSKTLTEVQKKDLQYKIKNALLTRILDNGYQNLSISEVLSVLELDMNIIIPDSNRTFVISQIAEVKRVFSLLSTDANIHEWALPRLQSVVETALEPAYTNSTYVDMNVTAESVTYSIFDKTDAVFDASACIKDTYYKNTLIDSNATEAIRASDSVNGLTLNFNNNSGFDSANKVVLYYPLLGATKTNESVTVFQNSYYFAFDKAWANTGKQIYIQTPKNTNGLYGCQRAKLDSNISSEIQFTKVYRYTDTNAS
ncbi:MAG: hypothetical protein NTW78_00845 [Campylobacterales bacterium]|nr:hypothetical protein [Campylobacterales bacterium]